MRSSSPFTRDRSPIERRRSISPNNYAQPSNRSSSIKSEHLWQTLEQVELFPHEFSELLKYEERNLNAFKKRIEREKNKVHQEFDALKRQLIHNIEDLKLSIQAELDRVYKLFMEKYAIFKSEILQIKRLRDEIENDLQLKRMSPSARYSTSPNTKLAQKGSNVSLQSNTQLIKSIESGQS